MLLQVFRESLTGALSKSQYFTIFIDGSCDVSNVDMQLIYVMLIIDGQPTFKFLEIKPMHHANASGITSHYRSHTGPIFAKYNVLTVTDMHTLELGTFMYRNSVNELPSSFNDYFIKRSEVHNYLTRHGNHLSLTKNKKIFSDHSVRTTGPRLWNALENSIRDSKSIKHFRNQMKQKLISSYV